jgi:hypothetical protein
VPAPDHGGEARAVDPAKATHTAVGGRKREGDAGGAIRRIVVQARQRWGPASRVPGKSSTISVVFRSLARASATDPVSGFLRSAATSSPASCHACRRRIKNPGGRDTVRGRHPRDLGCHGRDQLFSSRGACAGPALSETSQRSQVRWGQPRRTSAAAPRSHAIDGLAATMCRNMKRVVIAIFAASREFLC